MAAIFSGGENLKRMLAQMVESLGPGRVVRVGFLEGSLAGWAGPRPNKKRKGARRQGEPAPASQKPAAQVAFWLEYGTESMPARPFFSGMVKRESPTWGKLVAAMLKHSNYNSAAALQGVGLKIKAQLQQSINEFKTPDIKQSTKDRKGFDKPLIDSHSMIDSVSFEVSQ